MRALFSLVPLIIIASYLIALPTQAEVYRWVDDNGAVQYSDRPPEAEPPGGYDGPKQPRMADVIRAQREEQRRLEREEARRREREAEAQAYLESTAPPPKIESRLARSSCTEYSMQSDRLDPSQTSSTTRGVKREAGLDMDPRTIERRTIWHRLMEFMRCVYRHDRRVWRSIFGGR